MAQKGYGLKESDDTVVLFKGALEVFVSEVFMKVVIDSTAKGENFLTPKEAVSLARGLLQAAQGLKRKEVSND